MAELIKIHLPVSADCPMAGESVWAEPTDDPLKVKVRNITFFTDNIDFDDTVLIDEDRNYLGTADKGEYRTVRLLLPDVMEGDGYAGRVIDRAKELGAEGGEHGFGILVALNVKAANLHTIIEWAETLVDNRLAEAYEYLGPKEEDQ